jgi:hypothetical protein
VFCPNCGYRNSEGVNYCTRCGASLIADQADAQTTQSYAPSEVSGELTPLKGTLPGTAALVIRSGGGRAGETYELAAERTTMGRHPDSDVFLDDVTVSRNHAVIVHEEASYVIADEGSLNGTYVNRRRVERHVLVDGDELQIGKYKLTFITP